MKPIQLKITRDEARYVQHSFFPYLDQLTKLWIKESGGDMVALNSYRSGRVLFLELQEKFRRRLDNHTRRFTFSLTFYHAVALYTMLQHFPPAQHTPYGQALASNIITQIDHQLVDPRWAMWLDEFL